MAKLVGGPLGSYRGKAGGTIGTSWKGIPVVKAMPLSVANPDTVLQQAQRGKFSQCVEVARLLLSDLITPYWNPFAKRMSGYNAFIKQNIDAFDKDGLSVPENFYSARGILKGFEGLTAESQYPSLMVNLTWNDNTGVGDALGTDIPCCVFYNETQKYWGIDDGQNGRADVAISVADERLKDNDVVHFWIFFYRPDRSKVSDSSYVSAIV